MSPTMLAGGLTAMHPRSKRSGNTVNICARALAQSHYPSQTTRTTVRSTRAGLAGVLAQTGLGLTTWIDDMVVLYHVTPIGMSSNAD